MDIHKNARLTPHSRAELVRRVLAEEQAAKAVAMAFGVSVKTANKWVNRFQAEGSDGLVDRSSLPHRLRAPTPAAAVHRIEALRRQRWTGKQIAREVSVSPATVSRTLKRPGLNRPSRSWQRSDGVGECEQAIVERMWGGGRCF